MSFRYSPGVKTDSLETLPPPNYLHLMEWLPQAALLISSYLGFIINAAISVYKVPLERGKCFSFCLAMASIYMTRMSIIGVRSACSNFNAHFENSAF